MKITSVPNKILRSETREIELLDKKNIQLVRDLSQTLQAQKNPAGVGLAAPQINVAKRAFATLLSATGNDDEQAPAVLRVFINPQLVDHSKEITFGPNEEEPFLEGCLSIPGLYGPVPRYEWVELEFSTWNEDPHQPQLIAHRERFADFAARVVQHEYDHLYGTLFTDYSVRFDLPVYQENKRSGKLEEIDKRILEGW